MYQFKDSGQLKTLIQDYLLTRNDVELVELVHRFEGQNLVLRILVDKPEGGINLEECAQINREVCRLLDEQDLIQGSYTLEVSSPGLDRPLKSQNDFMRRLNKIIHVFLSESVNNKLEWEGIVKAVTDTGISLDSKGQIIEIPLSKINKAKQIF